MNVSVRYASKVWGIYAILVLLSVLFLASLSTGVLAVILNVVLLGVFLLLIYNDGAYNGEKACTLSATIEKQRKAGRGMPDSSMRYAFSRKTAAWAFVICLIPFLVVSIVNLAVAPFYPAEETVQEEEIDHGEFYFDYDADPDAERAPTNWVNVIARVVYMPYVFCYERVSGAALNGLFLLFAFIPASAHLAGYLCGPMLRKKKLRDIALGKKRKMRNLKVNKNKGPRRPKAEV